MLSAAGVRAQHEGHGAPPPPGGAAPERAGQLPEGHAEVQLSPERQQLIGLKVAEVQRQELAGAVRASATVASDQTTLVHVHTRIEGWVQRLYVEAVGERVEKGKPLYSLYSQELYAAQHEWARARKVAPELADAAKERLRLWGVPEDQLDDIAKNGPKRAVIFRAPATGTVLEKQVVEGHFVEPGMMLFLLGDLSRVWILAEVYEYEVNRLDPDGVATAQVQGVREPVRGRIDYVYPTVDPVTRTVRVRLVADNERGVLRPGSFATVSLPTRSLTALWIPEEAVVDTGLRQLVYLALPDGRFRPVVVRTGRRAEGRVEVVEGLDAGARVVVSAQFLIDSESRLRGVEGAPGGHTGH